MYFGYRTVIRQHAWTTPTRLWDKAYADGSRKLRVLVNLNSSYQQAGDYNAAQKWAVESFKRCPDLMPVKMNQAILLARHGKRDEGIAMLMEGVQKTPKIFQAWNILARLLDEAGRLDEALPAYLKVYDLKKGQDSDVANQIAAIYYRQGKLDQALPFFEIAYSLNPENGVYAYNVGMLHFKAGRVDKAQEWALKIQTGASVPPELHQLLASLPKN